MPDNSQSVSLGCGTLILIALIVLFFSRSNTDDLQKDVRQLQQDVRNLETTVKAQTATIDRLNQRLAPAERP